MTFELTPAATASLGFALTAEPAVAPTSQTLGAFIQFRLNGVDLGDATIDVVDFLAPSD